MDSENQELGSTAVEVGSTTETPAPVSPEPSETGSEVPKEAGVETSSEVPNPKEPKKPAYVPDYKLKVYNKDEGEITDPFLKNLIKDAESEKKVKEIAQKYLGFDLAKEKAEKVRQEFHSYAEQAAPIVDYYQKATQMLQKQDLESFFELVGIPDRTIYEYAVKKAQEAQLAPEQQQYLAEQRQLAKQKEYLESQNQTLQERQHAQAVEFRRQELNWVLAKPEVSSVMQAYDSSHGPNAFFKLVRRTALDHLEETGEDLSADQAIQKVFREYPGIAKPATSTQPSAMGQPNLIQQGEAPPVIPTVSGRGTSPVRRKVKSIDDIRKISEELSSS